MYKDVWKKFGVKVLIVLCSVLLVGGVAIAAPRLRAAPVNISTITIDDQTAEYQVDETRLKALQDAIEAGGTVPTDEIGLVQWPKSLTATIDGQKRTLQEGVDYTLANKNNINVSETGDTGTFQVTAISGSSLVAGTNSDYATVKFTIVKNTTVSIDSMKAELPMTEFNNANATTQTGSGNCWVVSGLPADFNASSWDIYIDDSKLGKIPLRAGVDYDVADIPQATQLGSNYKVEIELFNYAKKVQVDATVYKNLTGKNIRVEKDDTNKTVEVYDGTTKLEEDREYIFEKASTGTSYTIKGNPRYYYVGQLTGSFQAEPANFSPVFQDYTIDYDTAGMTIENPPTTEVRNNTSSGDILTYGENADYIISDYYFLENGEKTRDKTAGTVYMDFEGRGNYRGTITRSYTLTRSLSAETTGKKNEALTVTLDPLNEGDTFEYDGAWHAKIPKLSFKNAAGVETTLKEGTDYTVEYTLNGKTTTNYRDLIDAGMVFITITGIHPYTGKVVGSTTNPELSYRISPKDITKDKELALLQDGLTYDTFELTDNIKDQIFDHAYLQSNPYNNGPRDKVSDLRTGEVGYYYDQAGTREIEDSEWAGLQPGTDYYMLVEFVGNYTGTLAVKFQIQEYKAAYAHIEFAACDQCGATNNSEHIYTGEAHEPRIVRVMYQVEGAQATQIPESVYEGKVKWTNNINAGTATVEVPISDKVVKKETITIKPRDLSDGVITLTGNEGFYNDGGLKREYSGYTNLPSITTLKLDQTSDNKTLTLKPEECWTDKLYKYDSNNKSGTGAAVRAEDIVADGTTQYCFEVIKTGSNFTYGQTGRAWTEPFVFVPRDITLTGESGISVVVTPKPSIDSVSGYLAHIQNTNNLIITDNKLKEQVRTQDYEIVANSVNTGRMNVDSVVTFSIQGKGCYTNIRTDVELYVGKNITLTMLKEKRNNDIPVIRDPAPSPEAESTTGTVTLDGTFRNLDSIPWYEEGSELESSVSLRDHDLTPVLALLKGESGQDDKGKYSVQVLSSTPQPDNPNDTTGTRYAKVLIVGKNGYYGKITVKVPIEKTDFKKGDYKIVFRNESTYVSDDNVYTGSEVTPLYDVVNVDDPDDKTLWLTKDVDYEEVVWTDNVQANEGKQGDANKARLTIRGINGFENELSETFTIYKREIGVKKNVVLSGGITSVDERYVLNEDEGFRLEGWLNPSHSYDYTPSTLTAEGKEEIGVHPQLTLYFKYKDHEEQLQFGTDYTIGYANDYDRACYTDKGMTYEKLPKIIFDTKAGSMNSNFKGEFEATYEIQPIILSNKEQCKVTLRYYETAFTGLEMKPEVVVTLYRNGDKEKPFDVKYDPEKPDDNEFDVDWVEKVFVTVGGSLNSASTNPFLTHVDVKGNDTGNFQGLERIDYLIYGEFEPKGLEGMANSTMVVSPQAIKYSPTATNENLKSGCLVTYSQKIAGPMGNYDDPNEQLGKRHQLTTAEYVVTGVRNRIGKDLDARVETAVDYFRGGKDFKMTIVGDLAASYMDYSVQQIGYTGADSVELDKFLTVTYDTGDGGKQALSYGTDYMFESTPTAKLGKNQVNIIPIEGKSDDYLEGKMLITYYVTTALDSLILENVQATYQYAHGTPVIKPEDIIVKLGGQTLQYGQDYNIEIIGDATSVGTHTIVVTSANEEKFSGKKEQSFTITSYNLEDAVRDNIISVNYIDDEKEPYYTGSTVLPRVTSVTIETSSGSRYTLSDGSEEGKAAEYEIVAGIQGDHVNWTSGDLKPDFILRGKGNYAGEVSYEYSIKRKDISDESEVIVEDIEDIYYNNGKDITPVPSIKYRGRDLSGIRYSGNASDYVDWKDYSQHFTYQYSTKTDLKSTGTKEITIRGIGNFTGERTKSYKVIPLNIKDTELVFTGDTPVYDGTPKRPAFNLLYSGDVILQWTGSRVISDFINSAEVIFSSNNINATVDEPATITVRITGDNDNYTGEKEATFTILPASLDNHTKFLYRPIGSNANEDLKNYKLNLDFIGVGSTVKPAYAQSGEEELGEGLLGIYYDFSEKANHGAFLQSNQDYTIEYKYVEPDTDDVDVREDYQDPDISFAGKVKVTITGKGNYADTASFWYYIGKDISSDATISMKPTTAVYNSKAQPPEITVSGVEGLKYIIAKYKNEVAVENLIEDRDFVNAGNYFIRIEGDPRNGTYATKPYTLTYTITPRAFSNNLVIDGFKREYSYTGYEIRPVGISVTDYIDNVKYKLTEDVDYTLTYTNNLNAGTAYINVEGKSNFSGKATANFLITSSTISSGGSSGNNSFLDQGTGEISGATAVSPSNVNMSMDTIDAMYYTGSPVYPKVSIAGMTENVDYTVTFSNNVEVGTAVATISGIGNNRGTIVKNFRIIAQLSKCTISPIPAQQYTGFEVKPSLTVRCGSSILMEGIDYTVTYANNINIGTATATIRALNNANYTGSASVNFSIGNDVGGFIISGYAPSYAYTGNAITPGVVVETGSTTLTPGTDYTVSYSNNVNAGTATITVTGTGRYSGTQTANFIIEPKSMQSLTTTDVADRTYTGDAYTPDITVSDGGKVLTNGVDYTVTYTNNVNPGTATILIQGTSSNYTGTKVVSFKIAAVAVKGLKASTIKYNSIKLKWTSQGYADGYQICDSQTKLVKTVTTNSATITGLTAGKTYKYKVRSYIRNADGTKSYGAFSSVLSVTTKLKTPTVKVVSTTKGQARISWAKVSGATGYEIYYKKTASAKYKKLKTVNNANIRICTVRGLKSGDRAYFRVRAFRKSGSTKVYSSLNPLKVITVK